MKLSKFTKVPLREIWQHEALDFTKWLAMNDNLTLLGEELALDLVGAETEVSVGSFHVDILAEDSNGRRVIIENQLETTNHDHLGKLITYASGLQAETIIWVVASARQEHEQAINWLNEHTTQDANFFLIVIEAYRIGDSDPAPRFNVIAKPNDWAKIVRDTGSTKQFSELKLNQQAFWEKLKDYGERHPSNTLKSWQKTQPQHWYNISLGSSKAHLSATINSKEGYVGMELYIPQDQDKKIFSKIFEDRLKIETHLGSEIRWMELPDKKASRILITHSGDFMSAKHQNELVEWLYANAESFAKIFSPYLKKR